MTYDGPWMINDAAKDNPYQYNGKEFNLDHGLNWSDYGARWYDACVGRFTSVDPLAEEFSGWCPYNYVLNNPVKLIDPDGRLPVVPILLIAFLLAESHPASTPGSHKDHVTIKQAQDDYNKSQLFSLIPGSKQATVSKVVAGRVVNEVKSEVKEEVTSRAARREVMRDENIPTSMQPKSQSKNESGYEYSYEVPRFGGGKETKSVQQQTKDSSHEGQEHWEAGRVKTDPRTGEIRMTEHNRPKLQNNKSKVNVKSSNIDGGSSW